MSFVIEKMKDYDQLMVKDKNTGWFFPVESKIQAEELSKKLNELESKPMDLHKDFEEWETLINSVQSDQIDLITSKEEYEEFYKNKFNDYEAPIKWIHSKVEGHYNYNIKITINDSMVINTINPTLQLFIKK